MIHAAQRRPPSATRLALVPAGTPHPLKPSPLILWHLLSLDAPTVAASWTVFIAWSAGLRLPFLDAAAMFLAVWMLYAADRLLDARPLFAGPLLTELQARHRFHARHRVRFLCAIALASLPLLFLLHRTSPVVLHLYVLLTTLLVVWLLLVHARPATAHRLPKELAVGIFFPVAIFVPTVARLPDLRPSLLPEALSFAAVCTLNCLFLYAWEHPGSFHRAHPSTRWAVHHLPALAVACSSLAATLAILAATLPQAALQTGASSIPHPAAVYVACSLSAALLLALHGGRHRIPNLTLRALADLVLLTPVVILVATTFMLPFGTR